MNRRGSIILHVLVTGVVVAVIAAGVLRMTLMNYVATARATSGAQNRKEAEAMLSRALATWSQSGVCASIPGFACTGAAGTCDCYCPSSSASPRIWARVSGGVCKVDFVSSDPP